MSERRLSIRLTLAAIVVIAATVTSAQPQGYTFTTFAGLGGPGTDDGTGTAARFNQPGGMATDGVGNMYLADTNNHVIRKISPAGVVTTLAGRAGFSGSADGAGGSARFKQPYAVAVDSSGRVYVSDSGNHTIRRIGPAGVVTTVAGVAGVTGSADGTGSAALFNNPIGLAVDSFGNLLVADQSNSTIRKMTPAGVVTTVAGLAGVTGSADGTGAAARFVNPNGIAIDPLNNLYVADFGNRAIRKVTLAGVVTTVAGLANSPLVSVDGTGINARFKEPLGVAINASGTIFIADGSLIREMTPGGAVTTFAGLFNVSGSADGNGSAARFRAPYGLTTDINGNLFIAERQNHTIRMATPSADVTTFAGLPGGIGTTDGSVADARFSSPFCATFDQTGDMYVGENFTVRKIAGGVVTTLAGTPNVFGSSDGTGNGASFRSVFGIAIDSSNNLFVTDTGNHTIRKITPTGVVSTFAGVAQTPGSADGIGSAARFRFPYGITIDGFGNLYVADHNNYTIRMITPAGAVSTLAGSPGNLGSADGTGAGAQFYTPTGIAIDSAGLLYVSDENAHTIRTVTTPGGVVTTLAGSFSQIGNADGNGTSARFSYPSGITTDSGGNVFVTDRGSGTVRMIIPGGEVVTVGGLPGTDGDADGTGSFARFAGAFGLTVDSADRIYVSDTGNHKIRVGRRALLDAATIDMPTGTVGDPRFLSASPQTGTSFQWTLIRQPGTSVAEIQPPGAANAEFTPDVTGVYSFRLTASGKLSTSITAVSLSVGPLHTSTQLTSTPNPSTYGQNIELTALVLSEGTPTQFVKFYDAGVLIGSASVDSKSKAKLTISTLGVGVHALTASYAGDGAFDSSDSNTLTQTVDRATSYVGCSPWPNPSTFGESVTYTSSISGASATGTVTYKEGTTTLATNPVSGPIGQKAATFTTSSLSPGTHLVTATYSGDANYEPSTSGTVSLTVRSLFGPPLGLVATATTTTDVTVSWITVAEADYYELVQTSGPATVVTTPAASPTTIGSLTPGTTYLFKIRAVKSTGTMSDYSALDPATTILFADDPIAANVTQIKAVHITELREGVNAMRVSIGLGPTLFTNLTLSSGAMIKAVHLNELRAALTAARSAMLLPTTYSDVPITAFSTVMKAAHVREIRDAMQ